MKILVIGAGGFIGSHICEEIIKNHSDLSVVALDITSEKISHIIKDLEFIKADILTNFSILENALQNADVVLPLAAIANPLIYVQDPLRVFELDFEANLKIIKLCVKHQKRVVFPSTSEVYGMCSDDFFDEEKSNCVTGPIEKERWIYSCSKQMLDRVIYAHGMRDNLQYTIFRPFNWIGPRLDDIYNAAKGSSRVISQFLSNIIHNKNIQLVDGGQQKRSFTDISDAVSALIKIIKNQNNCASQQIFNIGNPSNIISIKNLAENILQIAQQNSELSAKAKNIIIENIGSTEYYGNSYQDVQHRVPSIKKAQTLLNWTPNIGIIESINKIVSYYFK